MADRFAGDIPESADPRVRLVADTAGERRTVIQTLAGGPLIVERYEHPRTTRDRYARAILTAAVDAYRLGLHSQLTAEFLHGIAGGYLDDTDRVDPPADWFRQGLNSAGHDPAHGITPLIPIRTADGPARPPATNSTTTTRCGCRPMPAPACCIATPNRCTAKSNRCGR